MSAGLTSMRPSVTLKLATSLDGRIALASGQSKWITGEQARAEVHRLRAAHDAVLVGSQTILLDDPELTARPDPRPQQQPLRILADSRGRVSAAARVFSTLSLGPVAVATLKTTRADHWPVQTGLEIWRLPAGEGGSVCPRELLAAAARAGVSALMLEGGGQIAAAFMGLGLVDRIEWFRAPVILGADAAPAIGAMSLDALGAAPRYARTSTRELGPDLWERYERIGA
jgi:diaminohydroxyphosphoribosylaminopyrimidine deaminase/5-amino-6-(5-phosphoribosylamino)uracil reductase